ncbi:hypothetical protein [Paenibacillus agaridevorans]|uniref:hypothetical protein n=1 Tax=Paenibacillus agaridevorans TaxID=171404 RepID=UPI001BE4849A|nr:hypothetical protein [Paenibacillus agaridevorans]
MKKSISPYELLKAKRPEKFSDSTIIRKANLNREIFDFYLDSLTSRGQEKDFEVFCRRMAEHEICPNLLPQTGPTGGGDSKVDSETYPISDDLALLWFSGIGREASAERWAFAISAKKDWRSKIKSDVKNIISTSREYKKIFFISNQYIPDKKRAAIEDELSNQYKIETRVLDRSWLLDKLFSNHREQIAVESFGLSDSFADERKVGPLDYKRQSELEKIEREISQYIVEGINSVALVENATQAAMLSRELELSFDITKGRFERAIALSDKYGTIIQQKECAYQWAWTLYWWYEKFDLFYEKYCIYESIILNGNNFFELERLTNLWMNLYTITGGNFEVSNFEAHTKTLIEEYKKFIDNKTRPNAALEARANFVFVKLMLGDNVDELVYELTQIINDCEGVLDFSLDTLSELIMNVSPNLKDSPKYDSLFDTIISASSSRKQELVAAKLLLKRGEQIIESKPYSAIRYIGRALQKLYKDESKNEYLLAMTLMAHACEKADLLWAGRGYYLNAFYIAFIDYMKFGNVSPLLVGCSTELKMIELRHGRIPHSLEWYKLDRLVKGLLISSGYDATRLNEIEDINLYDAILGMLLLRTSLEDLHSLASLPDVLDHEGLHMAAIALKYALGYVDEEIQKSYNDDKNSIEEFMQQWYNQPAKEQIPDNPILFIDGIQYFSSKIMGCLINIESDAKFPCIELAESILAAIESFLATAILDGLVGTIPRATIRVKYVETVKYHLDFKNEPSDIEPIFTITCSDFGEEEFFEAQQQTKQFILNFFAAFVAQIVMFRNTEQLEKLIIEDQAFDRSLNFTNSIFIIADLFGKNRLSLNKWLNPEENNYPLIRDSTIRLQLDKLDVGKTDKQEIKRGKSDNKEKLDTESVSQKDIEITKIINIPLWNRAQWRGIYFGWTPDNEPPLLALAFNNKEAAISIFKQWHTLVGKADENDRIRVGLIKGIDNKNPFFYKAILTANLENSSDSQKAGLITVLSRFRTMDVDNDFNLRNFESALKKVESTWKYIILPAYINPKNQRPELLFDYHILKKHIKIKNAWELEEDDWLTYAITPDDKPIIPPFVKHARIMDYIENLKRTH